MLDGEYLAFVYYLGDNGAASYSFMEHLKNITDS